jgi:2-amino-4-hydroxy-6-hydroxymethyldihydropteridine diphosphokinase
MQAFIALGGNLGNQGLTAKETIKAAIKDIYDLEFTVKNVSRLFQTPAFPVGSGPDYVNAAMHLEVENHVLPKSIFSPLTEIELAHGRVRTGRWGGRTLDIDFLALDDVVLPDLAHFQHWAQLDPALQAQLTPDKLILPHPRLHERAFVLVPLMDIAPDWRHPVFGQTVRQMFAKLPQDQIDSVIPLPP